VAWLLCIGKHYMPCTGVDDQGLVVGVKTYPCSCPKEYWDEPDASRVGGPMVF
jgi:hypothetical protein